MTDCCHQDELYPQFQESESHDEDDDNEQPSCSSDNDSETGLPNAMAVANKHMKQMHKMHRLSSSSSPQKKDRERKGAEDLIPKGKNAQI